LPSSANRFFGDDSAEEGAEVGAVDEDAAERMDEQEEERPRLGTGDAERA
jgi:hypothetical protein